MLRRSTSAVSGLMSSSSVPSGGSLGGHCEEVLGFVLEFSDLDEVVDALFVGLDMAVQHGRVLLHA